MAWGQKQETDQYRPTETATPSTPQGSMTSAVGETKPMENVANIGKSLTIKGELTGNEDLTIEGKVNGKIFLKDHKATIGPNGRVTADLQAKAVIVSGKLQGNVVADDRVEVTATGSMEGDVIAPRVVLADGARFKGSIDMEAKSGVSGATVSEMPRKTVTAKS